MPLRNTATWILSCNNPKLTHEISRRCVRIRIDPQTDRPWLRNGFRHAHLRRWAEDNRKERSKDWEYRMIAVNKAGEGMPSNTAAALV